VDLATRGMSYCDLDKGSKELARVVTSARNSSSKPVDRDGQSQDFLRSQQSGEQFEGLLTATTAAQVSGTRCRYAMTEGYTDVDAVMEG